MIHKNVTKINKSAADLISRVLSYFFTLIKKIFQDGKDVIEILIDARFCHNYQKCLNCAEEYFDAQALHDTF